MEKYIDLTNQNLVNNRLEDIKINKTCAVTGHRVLTKDFDIVALEQIIRETILEGYDTFLVGMAIGFDSYCFRLLEQIRREIKIKLVACVPCRSQSEKFSPQDKHEYVRMVNSADYVILLSDKYTPYCMQKRNKFMVDNSSVLISYLHSNTGGTKNTVEYALKMGKTIKSIVVKH